MDLSNAARPNKRRRRRRRRRLPRHHRINLSPDMLANIHGRLSCLDRLAFASVFREYRDAFKPEAPWLVLPGETPEEATLFSLADRRAGAVRAPHPALRGYAVLGSSCGWLATADDRGQMRLVNPLTGEQRALPSITTIPCLVKSIYSRFAFDLKPFSRGPPYAGGREPSRNEQFSLRFDEMRTHLYRKIVLSHDGHGTAMLITGWLFGVAAFTTAEGSAWMLAPSREGVEDAIHHDGRFYSVTYSGAVEVWEHDADSGAFTSAVVTPRLACIGWTHPSLCRKYLVAAPDGRMVVVLKESKKTTDERNRCRWACSFKVHVLDGGQWKETDDIGDAALFVGANESLFMSTTVHPEIKPGHVYYTEDDLTRVAPCNDRHHEDDDRQVAWVFSLKDGTEEIVEGLGLHRSWPPPAWFTPTIP